MSTEITYRILRTDWNSKHRHRPVKGATIEVRRVSDDETVASWSTDEESHEANLVVGERYHLKETKRARWHLARNTRFEAFADPADLPTSLRPRWECGDADLVVSDRHLPLLLLLAFLTAFVVILAERSCGGPSGVATTFANQIGITAPDTRPHVKISGATTFMSIEDTVWTAEPGDQPLVIRNPATNQSTGKVFDIPLDATSFDMPYEDLPVKKEAKAHVALYWEDDEGKQIGPIERGGEDVEFDWEFAPRDERGTTSVDLDIDGCKPPEEAAFVLAEVQLTENQSVDISPCIYLDYDGDAKGLSGQELIDALQEDYGAECVFDPVERDADGNATSYNFLIQPGYEVTSVHLDRAPQVGTWDLYVYYTALDTIDHHLCSPGLIGGTTVTVAEP